MIRELVKRLGLDRVEDYLSAEVRRVQLQVLQEERKLVQGLLARVDRRIDALHGGRGRAKKAGRRRGKKKGVERMRKPGERLRDYAVKAASNLGKTFSPSAIADGVKGLGYKTVADPRNLMTSIHKVLADKQIFAKVHHGIYKLRQKAAAE